MKLLLKCILSLKKNDAKKEEDKKEDVVMSEEKKGKKKGDKKKKNDNAEDDEGNGSRSNHQRLQAVELFGYLIKDCQNCQESRGAL